MGAESPAFAESLFCRDHLHLGKSNYRQLYSTPRKGHDWKARAMARSFASDSVPRGRKYQAIDTDKLRPRSAIPMILARVARLDMWRLHRLMNTAAWIRPA